jgi:hypothetical protein
VTVKSVTSRRDKIPANASPKERKRIQARNRKRKQRENASSSPSHASRLTPHVRKAPTVQDAEITSTAQITTGSPQGQMSSAFEKKEIRKVDAGFYEILREGIPLIDGAIDLLISFNGTIKPIGDKMDLVKELEDFCLNVPVCDMQNGIHAFHQNFANETFEQGFSISEFISTKDRRDIDRLIVADSKRIIFHKNAQGRYEPWYRSGEPKSSTYTMPGSIIQQILTTSYGQAVNYNGMEEIRLKPENKMYFSINNENNDPYGVSVLRSLDFVAQTLVTIQNAMKNTAERFGDPSYHLHYKGRSSDGNMKTRRETLQTDFNTTIAAKRAGKSADLVTAGGPDSEVTIKVIGHEGQVLEFQVQTRHLLEMIISKFHIPSWLLGIYWSTTERMATLEIEAALADAKIRQAAMLPGLIRLFSTFLRLRGRTWKSVTTSVDTPGDWGIIFETPNLRDTLAIAQARFLNAQADQMGTVATAATAQPKGHKAVGARHALPLQTCTCGQKELQRPAPWPELDQVESNYETVLKDQWAELQTLVMTILKLPGAKGMEQRGSKQDLPGSLPDLGVFTFNDEQRAQVMQAFKNWMGTFGIDDPNSPINWVYGEAYSLGLIQAAHMLSKDRPILDVIKNQDIFNQLCKNGFQLVKDNATKAIVNTIMPEMQAQMLAGTNPIHVAERLKKLFEDQNSDWERLARSEMSMAAEQAKGDEWAAWGVKNMDFVPAPDACSRCIAIGGTYPVDKCPLPIRDTHPRCRCARMPSASEVNG